MVELINKADNKSALAKAIKGLPADIKDDKEVDNAYNQKFSDFQTA